MECDRVNTFRNKVKEDNNRNAGDVAHERQVRRKAVRQERLHNKVFQNDEQKRTERERKRRYRAKKQVEQASTSQKDGENRKKMQARKTRKNTILEKK